MKLSEIIYFRKKEIGFPTVSCEKDPDHKTFSFDDKKEHPQQYVDNTEALFLIKKARDSFLTHIKLKDKHVKKNYLKAGLSSEEIDRYFYLSSDKKFYCFYLRVADKDFMGHYFSSYLFGIIERSTNKYLMMVNEFWSGSYEACYIKHNVFDYYPSDKYIDKTGVTDPPTMLSFDTNEEIKDKHRPLDIIDSLEDYFLTLFEELSGLN